ncbi:hypothetical protein N0V88_005724 [Collariella sp. IMI 366227]|nr:hypothetical protein N0V88_005724 [Collariella sp. IMI 366227]
MKALNNDSVVAAVDELENALVLDTRAAKVTSYPSPPLSSVPPTKPTLPVLTPPPGTEGMGKKKQDSPRNAKESWKRENAALGQQSLTGAGGKRKDHGGDKDSRAAKKQRTEGGGANPQTEHTSSPPSSTTVSVKRDNVLLTESMMGGFETNEEIALVRQTADFSDPQRPADIWKLYRAKQTFGVGRCKLMDDGKWKLENFNTTLYQYQVTGVSWMNSMELHPTNPRGGILADEMGLGKTVQLPA